MNQAKIFQKSNFGSNNLLSSKNSEVNYKNQAPIQQTFS